VADTSAVGDRRPKRSGRMSVPERALYLALVGLAVLGAVPVRPAGLPSIESLLEGAFIICFLLVAIRGRGGVAAIWIPALAYVSYKYVLMVTYQHGSTVDFIQAYKAYFYAVGLAFFAGSRIFHPYVLAQIAKLLTGAFLLKYLYTVTFGLGTRPALYAENNFELLMLIGLFYLAFPYMSRDRIGWLACLGVTVVLSGSRSAAVEFLMLYLFTYLRARNKWFFAHLVGIGAVAFLVSTVFTSRMSGGGIEGVDRVQFLQVFLQETAAWPAWEYLTGSFPITALSSTACEQLSFYTALFSHGDSSVCYSVILHAYSLRAIFDHGLLGLGLLYGLMWIGCRRSRIPLPERIGLLSLITANAFSVSAFNSVFAAILLAVAFGLERGPAQTTGARVPDAATSGRPASLELGPATNDQRHP
jgi:hypothetical protein